MKPPKLRNDLFIEFFLYLRTKKAIIKLNFVLQLKQ